MVFAVYFAFIKTATESILYRLTVFVTIAQEINRCSAICISADIYSICTRRSRAKWVENASPMHVQIRASSLHWHEKSMSAHEIRLLRHQAWAATFDRALQKQLNFPDDLIVLLAQTGAQLPATFRNFTFKRLYEQHFNGAVRKVDLLQHAHVMRKIVQKLCADLRGRRLWAEDRMAFATALKSLQDRFAIVAEGDAFSVVNANTSDDDMHIEMHRTLTVLSNANLVMHHTLS